MCDFNKGFVLCKCNDPKVIVHNKKSRCNKKRTQKQIEYSWTLYKFLDMSKEKELGRYMFPVSDVGNGLTSAFVLNELNNRVEFIFKNGKWEEDHYSPFEHEYEKIDNGKLKTLNDNLHNSLQF